MDWDAYYETLYPTSTDDTGEAEAAWWEELRDSLASTAVRWLDEDAAEAPAPTTPTMWEQLAPVATVAGLVLAVYALIRGR